MNDVNEKSLQLLPKKAFNHNLSMYSIALEGWRRGLTLNFFAGTQEGMFDIQFCLKNEKTEHQFTISKTDNKKHKEIDPFMDRLVRKINIKINEEPLDISNAIIDYFFPETINNQKSTLYFDFDKISDVLRKGLLTEVTVSDAYLTEVTTKYFHAYGDVNKIQFNNWLQQQALNLNLSGYVETLDTHVRFILIYGQRDSVEKFTQLLHKNVPLLQNGSEPQISVNKKQGFEIIN